MCLVMANMVQGHEVILENLRKQLAVAVRSIQWSYAIFWSHSTTQQGVLEWSEGYYNGDIKTRKTVEAIELEPDKIGLHRSQQLRELYKSLMDDDIDQQCKRPSTALSPEDLSDEEWYYLVCMSFTFNHGQGLPGRALANGQTIWLSDAQYADGKVFSRSLLAKSASIQTVVCFPHLGGVIELGVTKSVPEDLGLVQHVKTSLLDFPELVCSDKTISAPFSSDYDEDPACAEFNAAAGGTLDFDSLCSPVRHPRCDHQDDIDNINETVNRELNMNSANDCSNGCDHNHHIEDSFMLEGLNGDGSDVHSWKYTDDEHSSDVQNPINPSDCIPDALNQASTLIPPNNNNVCNPPFKELQEGNYGKQSSLDIGADDYSHYRTMLSVVLKNSNELTRRSSFFNNYKSNFVDWKQGAPDCPKPRAGKNVLKKILFSVPMMKGGQSYRIQTGIDKNITKLESQVTYKPPIASQRQKEKQNFLMPSSMVSSINETDKASILDDVINYVKALEVRVAELESGMEIEDSKGRHGRKQMVMVEQTSDNYEDKLENSRRASINKRKAYDVDGIETEFDSIGMKDGLSSDVKVRMKEKEVVIEMRCPYRENILLDVMDEIDNLHLDTHTIQSSTLDGILTLTLNSKFRGAAIAPARMIKQAVQKIASKC